MRRLTTFIRNILSPVMSAVINCTVFSLFRLLGKIRQKWLFRERREISPHLNKVIYIFWYDGELSAPVLVKECIRSWRINNETWDVVVLSEGDVRSIQTKYPAAISVQQLSDVLRLYLLANQGGVWVDATCFCLRPLDEWLDVAMGDNKFFAFENGWIERPVASWFLVSTQESAVIWGWLRLANILWGRPRKTQTAYFSIHYLFSILITLNLRARKEWRMSNRIDSKQCLKLKKKILNNSQILEAEELGPVQKLSWKIHLSDNVLQSLVKLNEENISH